MMLVLVFGYSRRFKSKIRSSKSETNSNNRKLKYSEPAIEMRFWSLPLRIFDLFRLSSFVLRISCALELHSLPPVVL
jgi:hypothetical protein